MSAPSKTVCVLGCSGFVGSHIAAALLQRGYSVHGTMRNASDENTAWLRERVAPLAKDGATLRVVSADLADPGSLEASMAGCEGVFFAAGTERQAPETLETMVGGLRNTLQAALATGVGAAMITSSTGSTNPPGPEPVPKRELEHWSDPVDQILRGKYSPAAKTLMEAVALRMMEDSEGVLRVAIFTPSMIAGPAFQPELVPSLRWLLAIIKGERMADSIPNGSMSAIDVRDLAALQIAAFEQPEAKGRYFAVKRSYAWREILSTLQDVCEPYSMPDVPEPEHPVTPTQFDLSRQQSLGVVPRNLDAILAGVVEELRARKEL